MSLQRFAELTTTNAARILGLYPRKGVIAAGSDVDIVFIDPSIERTLTEEDFHVSDYSSWEGWPVEGAPTTTISRGKVIVENGQLSGSSAMGTQCCARLTLLCSVLPPANRARDRLR